MGSLDWPQSIFYAEFVSTDIPFLRTALVALAESVSRGASSRTAFISWAEF
jgi:hypothetical protein